MGALRFVRLLQMLAINGLLITGLLTHRLSSGTVLAAYWFETLLSAALISVRIYVHRALTAASGHYVVNSTKTKRAWKSSVGTVLQGYVLFAVLFTVGHGIFIAVIISMLNDGGAGAFDPSEFTHAAQSVSLCLAVGFIFDMAAIRRQPFAWITLITQLSYLRVVLMQFVVIFGAALAAAGMPVAAVVLFLVLKVAVDLLGTQLVNDPVKALMNPASENEFDEQARARLLRKRR